MFSGVTNCCSKHKQKGLLGTGLEGLLGTGLEGLLGTGLEGLLGTGLELDPET